MAFREAFTKEKKEALNYDSTAFLFFAGTVLLLILIPWVGLVLRDLFFPYKSRRARDLLKIYATPGQGGVKSCSCQACNTRLTEKRRKATSLWNRLGGYQCFIRLAGIALLFFILYHVVQKLLSVSEINTFDPFEILNVPRSSASDERLIRKAYRRMSLTHHPDKNPNDPLAHAKFILITKAYQALSDDTARKNYEKYGNPDGPGVLEVGIGLPQFLVDEEYQAFSLALFMLIVIIGIPFGFIYYYQQQKNYYPNGVRVETVQFLGSFMTENTNVKRTLEFLAASAESREMLLRSQIRKLSQLGIKGHNVPDVGFVWVLFCCRNTDEVALEEVRKKLGDSVKKSQFATPIVRRNFLLLMAHVNQLREMLNSDLQKDVDYLLKVCSPILQSMIEIAFIRNWFPVIRVLVETRRSLMQAVPPNVTALAQVPHYAELPASIKKTYQFGGLRRFAEAILKEEEEEEEKEEKKKKKGTRDATENTSCASNKNEAVVDKELVAKGLAGENQSSEGSVPGTLDFSACITSAPSDTALGSKPGTVTSSTCTLLSLLGSSMPPQHKEDIVAFCRALPRLNLKYNIWVEGENEIVEGDLVTLRITLTRTQLQPNEKAGPVHAPALDDLKYEQWWLFLIDKRTGGLLTYKGCQNCEAIITEDLRFIIPAPGKWNMELVVMCDFLAGLDLTQDLSIKVHSQKEVVREYRVHPDDEALDDEPTMFQQVLGQDDDDEEEEEEEEDMDDKEEEGKRVRKAQTADRPPEACGS